MKTASDVSFELPPKVLTDIRRYYPNTQLYVRDIQGATRRPGRQGRLKRTTVQARLSE